MTASFTEVGCRVPDAHTAPDGTPPGPEATAAIAERFGIRFWGA